MTTPEPHPPRDPGAPVDDLPETDVCVVGAGPAGLALSLMLLCSGVRVTLLEKSTRLEREFRGEILQPGGQSILDSLGVLAAIRSAGACELDGFQLVDRDRVLLDIDYRRLPPPYDHLLAVPQRHVLEALLAACRTLPGFHYLDGHRVSGLIQDTGRVTGAVAAGPGGRRRVRAAVVVAADGRFSKTRALAGIDAGRVEAFRHDVLWFKLDAPERQTRRVRVHRTGHSPVLVHDSHPDRLQIGWTLPHQSWPRIAARGVDEVKRELAAALPQFADLIEDGIGRLSDLSLLDVFAGKADEWTRDGLVLVGDSAHTHSPLGAQGINLALQDAAVLHPVLLRALADGDTSKERFAPFVDARTPAVNSVMKMQQMQAKGMFGAGGPAADLLRSTVARLIRHSPLGVRITDKVAFGRTPVEVRTDLFTTTPAARPAETAVRTARAARPASPTDPAKTAPRKG
ncbi:2-polyprenyl-6-methoxyphenol hydroxylase [Streptomyces sp. cf386]|uniref:FAD-dependent monooxygenase n=1 Tax=Streptomyces sp. cf386 TaxID=1761904 RepID=UPI00087E268E|nr:FAD-dependent monooxygenase [Streptomyces sp. cf386]SDP00582.1 2-polyprenyl-6-methoxyphenol hydroxylase [Streptomyces sp. cf386]